MVNCTGASGVVALPTGKTIIITLHYYITLLLLLLLLRITMRIGSLL